MKTELDNLCEAKKVKIVCKYGEAPYNEAFPNGHPYKVTLRYEGRRLTCNFYCGSAITEEPSAADVLSCLLSDTSVSQCGFEDFCANCGCDSDSHKIYALYEQCVKQGKKVRKFLGSDYDMFSQAEH